MGWVRPDQGFGPDLWNATIWRNPVRCVKAPVRWVKAPVRWVNALELLVASPLLEPTEGGVKLVLL